MRAIINLLCVAGLLLAGGPVASAGITISPYVSVKSTKSVKPNAKDKSKEDAKVKQRQEAGLRGAVSFWRIFKIQLGLGQSKLTTTEKSQKVVDEYGELDYEKDLNVSTDDPESEVKITETQNNAKLSIILDPSFWIFIMRAKIGVTAQQRIIESEQTGQDKTTLTHGPTYKPHSGVGLGIRLGRLMHVMAEYSFYHYKFPKIEPFEREVALSFSVSI